ncbi:MAG: hypothetical protein IJ955_02480 [Oscillospiraceae bacterium]|nr:hypothetical protein [Oscillospiraceae bacterium]
MTKVVLLEQLKLFTEDTVKDLLLPVAMQEKDIEPPPPRAAQVFRTRLPDSKAAKKKAPYILHQIITGKDTHAPSNRPDAETVVRTIFCVHHEDEQEGGLALLNLMERLRIELLRQRVIGRQFRLDLEAGLETLVYPDDTAPYYAGEMISTWKLPTIEREVQYGKEGNGNFK